MTLYDITGSVLKLQDLLLAGEIEEDTYNDTMESVLSDFANKADDYGKVLKNLEADAEAIKKEKDRLAAKEKTIKNGIKNLKDRLLMCMEASGQTEINGEVFRIKRGKPSMVLPEDLTVNDVPKEYLKYAEPTIDKVGLLRAVKEGKVNDIDLVPGKASLRIS